MQIVSGCPVVYVNFLPLTFWMFVICTPVGTADISCLSVENRTLFREDGWDLELFTFTVRTKGRNATFFGNESSNVSSQLVYPGFNNDA